MGGSIEFEGKSVEEAMARAEAAVGRKLGANEYSVVDAGKKGLFGIGSRHVLIRLREAESEGGDARATIPSPAQATALASAPAPPESRREPDTRRKAIREAAGSPSSGAPAEMSRSGGLDTRHEAIRKAADSILRAMDVRVSAKLRDRDGMTILDIGGQDAGYLLERDGEGVEALQYILNRVLSKDPQFDRRIVVDCEGHRARRDQDLVSRAEGIARQVRETGTSASFDGLNPYERRLIHVALTSVEGVRTYSTEHGGNKRLVIEATGGSPGAEQERSAGS